MPPPDDRTFPFVRQTIGAVVATIEGVSEASKPPEVHYHGPGNAEHELRKAYYLVTEVGTTFFWDRRAIPGVGADEVVSLYRHAYNSFRAGHRLAAERWARAVKHLGRAFACEARIAYLEPRSAELPYLEGAQPGEYNLHEKIETTGDLLDSLAEDLPPGLKEMPENMKRYLARGRRHLEVLKGKDYKHELLRAERIKAAHEYGRVLECMALAYEADAARTAA